MRLGVPEDLVADAVAAAAKHSPSHKLLAVVECALNFNDGTQSLGDEDLVAVLEVDRLPMSPREHKRSASPWDFFVDRDLSRAQVAAAAELLRRADPRAVELIEARATNAAEILGTPLRALLRDHGHGAAAVRSEYQWDTSTNQALSSLFSDQSISQYPQFLHTLAKWPAGNLTTRQQVELGDLGNFLQTLRLNELGAGRFFEKPSAFQSEVADLVADLFDFDRSVLAAQAAIAASRLEVDNSLDTYYSLFDMAHSRVETDWSRVLNPERAVELLLDLFELSVAQARLAAICMWRNDLAATWAAPELRRRCALYANSVQHQQLVALTLASFPSTPEPLPWLNHHDPVLRSAAAQTVAPLSDGMTSAALRHLLWDRDGLVRDHAITSLGKTNAADKRALLEALIADAPVGWTCRHCRTYNQPTETSCTKDHYVGVEPVATAKALLRQSTG